MKTTLLHRALHLATALCILSFVLSCSSQTADPQRVSITFVHTQPETRTLHYLCPAEGDALRIEFVSSVKWHIPSLPDWIQSSIRYGQPGHTAVTLKIAPSSQEKGRVAMVRIVAHDTDLLIILEQEGRQEHVVYPDEE